MKQTNKEFFIYCNRCYKATKGTSNDLLFCKNCVDKLKEIIEKQKDSMEHSYKKRFDFIVKHLEFEISELEKLGEFSQRITSHIMASERLRTYKKILELMQRAEKEIK